MNNIKFENIDITYIDEDDENMSMFVIYNNAFGTDMQKSVLKNLQEIDDWKGGEVMRLQKWYHDENKYFADYWKNNDLVRWRSNKMEDWLKDFREHIVKSIDYVFDTMDEIIPIYKSKGITKPIINSSLVNFYRDGNDAIKYHKDDEGLFGNNPTVAICSLGKERPLMFKRTNCSKYLSWNPSEYFLNQKITIKNGDLFLMMGSVQKYFGHGIEPDDSIPDSRYSIVFREHKL